jgi:signal transduction histidine kinase
MGAFPLGKERSKVSVRPDDRFVRRFRALARAGALSCIGLGVLVLLGWVVGIEPLKRVFHGAGAMKPGTALCMALLGASLALRLAPGVPRRRVPLAIACAVLASTVASVILFEYLSGSSFWIDRVLFPPVFHEAGPRPGRMAPLSAFGFLFLGASLASLHMNHPRLAHALALPAGFTSAGSMIGYVFQAQSIYTGVANATVAIHTAVGQNVLFLSILLGSAESGLMRLVSSSGPGGMTTRRLLAPVLLLFPVLGLLHLLGQRTGWFDPAFGTGILTLSFIFLFGALVIWSAGRVDRQETARIAGEEELARRSVLLARSNADLEQFAYVASHDLQEPLRMIASYLELLERRYKGRLDEDADVFIGFAVDGAKRLQVLIQDLLSYSRLSTRALPPEPVNSETVLEEAIQDFGVSIQESNAEVTHGPLPTVVADRAQLAQVFRNLLGNALKFHSDASPKVHVSVQREADQWRFSVGDNGIGMDPQHAERVFRMFQRLHTREEYPGTGIGLAVCRKIVERHGGRIWLESERGAGTRMFFTLPVEGGMRAWTS